jgi:hypothetical protein
MWHGGGFLRLLLGEVILLHDKDLREFFFFCIGRQKTVGVVVSNRTGHFQINSQRQAGLTKGRDPGMFSERLEKGGPYFERNGRIGKQAFGRS